MKFNKKSVEEKLTVVETYAENDKNYGVCKSKINGAC